jgi:transglutaminase-like putative cysteine protease
MFRTKAVLTSLLTFVLLIPVLSHAQGWTAPTPEELKMTSISEVPGADAVILNRDELDDDDNHVRNIYTRIKILTESGLKYGDVELRFDKRSDARGTSIGEIYARTVEPDGSIVPFTGKPYDKLLEKDKENAYTARVFSFPAVKVGSILEYRYTIRWDDNLFIPPDWTVQGDLFVRRTHYLWKPTDKELRGTTRGGRENISQRIAWARSLPAGKEVNMVRLPTGRLKLELEVADVMPFYEEDHMPPVRSSRYHVFFYYTPYVDAKEYWTSEFKYWNSDTRKFENVSNVVREQAQQLTAGATSDEDKARKLYAFVMTIENTDYTRKRTTQEEKAEIKSAEDVLKRKHGSSDQITMTYIALAHAAGLEASAMAVTDRDYLIFDANWLDFNQLSDEIAVVKYGGEDHYLDPGSRYAPFGHLEWGHTMSSGVRQDSPADVATMFKQTPPESYKYSHTSRVGDLKIEPDGHMTGIVTLTFDGNPALQWRHTALRNDEGEVRDRIKKRLESWMPGGTQVEIKSLAGVDNGEVPLKITASVDGHIGNSVGSRVMLPGALFESNSKPAFPHEKRDRAVYFPYSEFVQDAVRYTLPAGYTIESVPQETARFQNLAAYSLKSTVVGNTVTLRRDFILADLYYPLADYPAFRAFYGDFEHKDHNSVVLKRTNETASIDTPPAK